MRKKSIHFLNDTWKVVQCRWYNAGGTVQTEIRGRGRACYVIASYILEMADLAEQKSSDIKNIRSKSIRMFISGEP